VTCSYFESLSSLTPIGLEFAMTYRIFSEEQDVVMSSGTRNASIIDYLEREKETQRGRPS
jgi:hypothetical protein